MIRIQTGDAFGPRHSRSDTEQISWGKVSHFPCTIAESTLRTLMDYGLRGKLPTRPVRTPSIGFCPSTRRFVPCFLRTSPRGTSPCIITRPSPPSGRPEDFHLLVIEHAQHTTKAVQDRRFAVIQIRKAEFCFSRFGLAISRCRVCSFQPPPPPLARVDPRTVALRASYVNLIAPCLTSGWPAIQPIERLIVRWPVAVEKLRFPTRVGKSDALGCPISVVLEIGIHPVSAGTTKS